MIRLRQHTLLSLVLLLGCGGFAPRLKAGEPSTVALRSTAIVGGEGVFLDQIVTTADGATAAHVRMADAPAFGQTVVLTRAQIVEALKSTVPDIAAAKWTGADRIAISRRSRSLGEAELKELLTATLQRDQVRDKGELQLRFPRPWTPVSIPDEPVEIKILDMPTSGVCPSFIARFEVVTRRESAGTWQIAVNAQVMREVWVARTPLRRGQSLGDADMIKERRDALLLRDVPWDGAPDLALEIKESVPGNGPLYARAVGMRAVVHRGQTAEAFLRDGAMSVSLKVEVLEEGEPGQTVRVRNPATRREFRGRVLNEQTIQLLL